jgi:glutamine amidotransferase
MGQPLPLRTLLFESEHGIVDESGSGFGVGWYDGDEEPGLYRTTAPGRADPTLHDLAGRVASPLVLSHVRAADGAPFQATNCQPFLHDRWLFVHGGAPVRGATDSEALFGLALSLGLEDDPLGALALAISRIEERAPVVGSFGISDGEMLWVVRHATAGDAPSLFVSAADDRLVICEPRDVLPATAWERVPEATALTVGRGGVCARSAFTPGRLPTTR